MMKRILTSLFLCLPFVLSARSYVIKHLGIKEGLSNNHVVSIAQDKQGFLWFATEEGLNKFDGVMFKSYYKKEENTGLQSITGNELNCLLDDPVDSVLWIGTQRAGLNAYDYARDTFTTYKHREGDSESLITDDITKIVPASDNGIWVCTYWQGIDYFDKSTGKFRHYNTHTVQGLVSNQVWTVTDGGNGLLYVGHVRHGFSILSLKEKKAKNFTGIPGDRNSLPGNEVKCVYKDRNGNIWVGTNKGLALYNPQAENFISFNDKISELSQRIYDIKQWEDNKLWIATESDGIVILDLSQPLYQETTLFRPVLIRERNDEYGLSGSSIRCLFQDSFNNIWAGTWGGGISFIGSEPPLFGSYPYSSLPTKDDNLTDRTVLSICMDKEDKLWIGTDGNGINVFSKGKRVATYTGEGGFLNGNTVQCALCNSQGELWFGAFYGGITHYDPKKRKFMQILPKEKANTDVRSFHEDAEGNIWAGTSEGIYIIDAEQKTVKAHYERENNLVRCVLKDTEGQVWVGFFGGGLGVYDSRLEAIGLFDVKNGFPSNTVNDLYQDRHNRLWVATGEGLVCFPSLTDRNYDVYRRESGLANTHIQAIEEDRDGNIWVSTNTGISCLLDAGKSFHNYDHHDNLPMGNFNRGSSLRTADGCFYFGSIGGLCYFNPEVVLQHRQSPPALITGIEISGPVSPAGSKPHAITLNGRESIKLKYTQNSFSVRFNIQNYALVNQVEYAYMLKGLEDTWHTLTGPDGITFRNLAPGKYHFLVKTRMRNQQWSDEVTSLEIRIDPPVWLSWWAKGIYVLSGLAVVCSVFYAYKKRLDAETLYKLEKQSHEQEQELNNERLRFYTNITHELRTPLTLILGPLEDIRKNSSLSAKDSQRISVIHRSSTRLLNLINQILEFRKTETQNKKLCVSRDDIAAFIREVGLKYKELNNKPLVDIRLETGSEPIMMYFDREIVQIILDNLISNALKYTERGSITIGVDRHRIDGADCTELRVSDTGHGIKPEAMPHIFDRYYQEEGKHQASGTGIGLSLVKSLVALHEGRISVESRPGEGSVFRVDLLTDNKYPGALHADSPPEEEKPEHAEEEAEEKDFPPNDRPILLVVEDNPDICDYIAESLADDFEVKTAPDGKSGKESALRYIPDIIVSDIMMPVMDGNAMCRELKRDVRTSHIPIILLTAKDSLKDKEEGYAVDADSYLTKPVSASLLRSRIHNILRSRRQLARHFEENTAFLHKSAVVAESLNKLDNEFLLKINQRIEADLSSEKLNAVYLADKMCMSHSTLYRKLKALTGLSINEYVRKIRVNFAERFLLEGKYSIAEVASKTGFNNLFYFRRCFKEEFGFIPSDYLKRMKENAGGSSTAPEPPSADVPPPGNE